MSIMHSLLRDHGPLGPTPLRGHSLAGSDSFWSFNIEELDGLDRLDHDGPAVRCRCSMKS